MKAAVLKGIKELGLVNVPMPVPSPQEVLIKVRSCGICGTDQHIYHGHPGSAAVNPPIILGHELAGEVVEVGEGIRKLKTGDRISILIFTARPVNFAVATGQFVRKPSGCGCH
ncbi:alcohol dehydrogenase catalytic domain-containing protein [Neobacillus sp. PS3-34]|uniref:alcohol dehydrogenase catalytic domain-containing protein n=1 Tax=Neobacillus sp. PS3-34 TaxID=3070678 RepID=UPI0027DF46C3|nr:alcohol dehydrogenase catalytic domain-containing protein [Neobacillus sp. PS3-34]WML49125.1 alcohol dehydrogenase catalytic domain-containing protein [Neobacillus sp. PS3-34]